MQKFGCATCIRRTHVLIICETSVDCLNHTHTHPSLFPHPVFSIESRHGRSINPLPLLRRLEREKESNLSKKILFSYSSNRTCELFALESDEKFSFPFPFLIRPIIPINRRNYRLIDTLAAYNGKKIHASYSFFLL